MSAIPPQLKLVAPFLKLAADFDTRAPAIAYWCRVHAMGVVIEKVDNRSQETLEFMDSLLKRLEDFKELHQNDEYVSDKLVAEANLENQAIQALDWADREVGEGRFSTNVVKAFHTASILFQVLSEFGELDEESVQRMRYSQFKATSIHKALKSQEPSLSPAEEDQKESFGSAATSPPTEELEAAAAEEEVIPSSFERKDKSKGIPIKDIQKAQRFCGKAISALNDELGDCATEYIQKSLKRLAQSSKSPAGTEDDPEKGFDLSASSLPTPTTTSSVIDESTKEEKMALSIEKAKGFCTFAYSALMHEDAKCAADYLQKALVSLQD